MQKRFRQGFTIVEVVTAIFIIAVLAVITVLSYNTVQARARDDARAASATIIMSAIEKYYDAHGEYPYSETMNPTFDMSSLPNYNSVYAVLPSLNEQILNAGGYNFFPYACATSSCSSTTAQSLMRLTQYQYYTQKPSAVNSYMRYSSNNGLWGCQITIPSDTDPAAVLSYKEESTGKWVFLRTKHGSVTIADYGTGPIAPTTCTFTPN